MGVIKKTKYLFSDKIWDLDTGKCSKFYAALVRFVKLLRITVRTFFQNRMGFQCVSLSYFVTLSIVPFLAFIFAVSGDFGLTDKLSAFLFDLIPTGNEATLNLLVEKADNMIAIARSSGVGFVSALIFLWAVLWMMFQVERVFNNVWGVQKIPRKIYKRFGFYLILLFMTPFVMLLFAMCIASFSNLMSLIGVNIGSLGLPKGLPGWLLGYVISTFILSAMYKFIPAVNVVYKYALKAAAIDAVFFCLFQYLYVEAQVFVARANMVYGVLAAVPLFLIWLNFSWQIIIYGAELNYSYQNIDTYHI